MLENLPVNKDMIIRLGLNAAVVYGELLNQYLLAQDNNTITVSGYFPCRIATLEEETTLAEYAQRKAIAILVAEGIIETTLIGLPRVRHFKLLYNMLEDSK